MDLKKLHEQFKDDDSPSVEGQIRWLQKQGFDKAQVERAMVTVYSELHRNQTPLTFMKRETKDDGGIVIHKRYGNHETQKPSDDWDSRPIVSGEELDQYLLYVAKEIRTRDLTSYVKQIEKFEEEMRKKWEADRLLKSEPEKKRTWWRRR